MSLSRRKFLRESAAAAASLACLKVTGKADAALPARVSGSFNGPFQPNWDSLQNYECPEWFRNAKFGIWAHWSAQCVPEQGDWYARGMYQEGSEQYNYHCAHYGHPSKFGFKDIDHIWKADEWDPEKLIGLYKAAGARYFFALANHHDNFDCYDSKYQPWNSVNLGPKKDIVGIWAKSARKAGLRFGVSVHASHAWNWFEVAQGADTKGPYKGVPYDGIMTRKDGAGLWWQGLNPNVQLYAQNHKPGAFSWEYTDPKCIKPDEEYISKFYNRVIDLIDKYHPDVLYFDDTVLPIYPVSDIGLKIAAYYYNDSVKRHGKVDVTLNGKGLNEQQKRCMVEDLERGRNDAIVPYPWQTDTCIGDWHYKLSLYENHQYKTPYQVVRMLLDIVSKNGCLMLNIPLKGNGSPDPDEFAFLEGLTDWMNVNSEAIHDTRPWKIAGEGPGRPGSDSGHDGLTSEDFRFTTKGNILYAATFGWPESGKLNIRTLASNAQGLAGKVRSVQLLGSRNPLNYQLTPDGLEVTLPENPPCNNAWILKIEGLNLAASNPQAPLPPPVQETSGVLILTPETAILHGGVKVEGTEVVDIGFWDSPNDFVYWKAHFTTPGSYAVTVKVSTGDGPTSFLLNVQSSSPLTVQVPQTGSFSDYRALDCGTITIGSSGDRQITVKPADPAAWHAMNLAEVKLMRTGS